METKSSKRSEEISLTSMSKHENPGFSGDVDVEAPRPRSVKIGYDVQEGETFKNKRLERRDLGLL